MTQPTHTANYGPWLRRLALVGLALMLSACQVWDRLRPMEEPAPASPEPVETEVPPSDQPVALALPPATIQQVIEALDRGQLDEAEAALLSIIDKRPSSRLALRFLEQLQSDPIELMGEDYDVMIVQPGDSLSAIAQNELGDAMQFFALARYNGIDAPRRMSPGIELKIPRSLRQNEDPLPMVESPAIEPALDVELDLPPGAGLAIAAQNLVESGRTSQAIALLSAGAQAGNLDSDGEQLLAEATVQRADSLVAEGRQEDAVALLNEITELLSPAGRPLLDPGRRQLGATQALEQGLRARRAGNLDEALTLFEQGLTLDPDNAELQTEAANLRDLRVAQLHDEALIHYRDQELDRAIELWEEVHSLAPDFEPAEVYLERAIALRERLRALD
jgi:tetratricopeptide (TPR) repeat protein